MLRFFYNLFFSSVRKKSRKNSIDINIIQTKSYWFIDCFIGSIFLSYLRLLLTFAYENHSKNIFRCCFFPFFRVFFYRNKLILKRKFYLHTHTGTIIPQIKLIWYINSKGPQWTQFFNNSRSMRFKSINVTKSKRNHELLFYFICFYLHDRLPTDVRL